MPAASSQRLRATGKPAGLHLMPHRAGVRTSAVNAAIMAGLIIAALYLGKIVFLPLAAAILAAFVLAPIVKVLRLIRIPRVVAAVIVVSVTFSVLGVLGFVFSSQVRQLAAELPRYESTLREKVRELRVAAISSPAIERAAQTLQDLQSELERPAAKQADAEQARELSRIAPGSLSARSAENDAERSGPDKPIAVEIHYPSAKPLDNLIAVTTPLVEPFAMLAIVVVLVLFILVQKEELRDRFIRLSGSNDMQRTTAAMTDAAQRLSRFLLTLTALNVAYGMFMTVALWWLGIPAPVLWGIVAALMRFVPVLGSFIAALFPVLLAAAVDPGWGTFVVTAGLFIVSEAMMGQVIEPLAQGRSTGLSPLAILIAAAFWTILWGPAGLLLAIPITLCLLVLGQHVDHLKFLHVLLGDEPALSDGERFYQRTLAGDATEITELAEQRMKQLPLSVYYNDVAIEGLRLAQADADRSVIDDEHMAVIEATVETMVDNLWELPDQLPEAVANGEEGAGSAGPEDADQEDWSMGTADLPVLDREDQRGDWQNENAVVCLPAESAVDKAAAHILSHVVSRHGVEANVVDQSALFASPPGLPVDDVRLVCICSLKDQLAAARYLARRIARRLRDVRIVVVLWGADKEKTEAFAKSWNDMDVSVAGDLRAAVEIIIMHAQTAHATASISARESAADCAPHAAATSSI